MVIVFICRVGKEPEVHYEEGLGDALDFVYEEQNTIIVDIENNKEIHYDENADLVIQKDFK